MSKQPLNQEDIELFRKTIGDVRPVVNDTVEVPRQTRARVRQKLQVPVCVAREQTPHRPKSETINVTSTDEILYKRPGLQDKVVRRLRRGQYRIAAELDLHGMTSLKAKGKLDNFLERIILDNQSCIRIIHGKGYGSKDGLPVIKTNLQYWLQSNHTVLAYSSCQPADGGTGAVYVLLKN